MEYDGREPIDENESPSLEEQILESNLRYMSSDTQTFRVGIFKKLMMMENQLAKATCVANPDTVKEHEKLIKEVAEKHSKLDTSVQLLAQSVKNGNENILTAIKELKDGRDTNATNIAALVKEIGRVNGKVEQGKTTLRVSLWWIGVFWLISCAILGALFLLHDKVPHDNPTTIPHKDIVSITKKLEER